MLDKRGNNKEIDKMPGRRFAKQHQLFDWSSGSMLKQGLDGSCHWYEDWALVSVV